MKKKITTWASTHPELVWWRSLGAGDGDGLAGTPVSVRQESVVRVFKIRLVYRCKVVALVKVSWGFKILDHDKNNKKKEKRFDQLVVVNGNFVERKKKT